MIYTDFLEHLLFFSSLFLPQPGCSTLGPLGSGSTPWEIDNTS
jgi:hypothetical protein